MTDIQLVPIIAGCLITKDGTYLLVQEKQPKAYGLWNLPAGRVDEGESIEEGAIREAKEETGLEVALGEQICIEHDAADRPVFHAFRATIVGGELHFDPEEMLDAKWLSLDEIKALNDQGKIRNGGWALRVIKQ